MKFVVHYTKKRRNIRKNTSMTYEVDAQSYQSAKSKFMSDNRGLGYRILKVELIDKSNME